MSKIYSYVLRFDDGVAPNPFGGKCTLTICKPVIRRKAEIGDWVVGTGSKNSRLRDGRFYDFSKHLVYAMKITDVKSLEQYDAYCRKSLKIKIPDWLSDNFAERVGDCIYDYSIAGIISMRRGVHNETNKEKDLRGVNSLLSEHFYYFGEEPKKIPEHLLSIVKSGQGHKIIQNEELIAEFENWISEFHLNEITAQSQLQFEIERLPYTNVVTLCSDRDAEDDKDESEEIVC